MVIGVGRAFSTLRPVRTKRGQRRETVLENPLGAGHPAQIVFGRLRGIWSQFLPAMVLLFVAWHFLDGLEIHRWGRMSDARAWMLLIAGAFASVPMIGLYLSLRLRHQVGAWMATLALGLGAPLLILSAQPRLFFEWGYVYPALQAALLFPLAAAAAALVLLFRNLHRREFALEGKKTSAVRPDYSEDAGSRM
jgi:hypothetical protein